MYKTEQTPGVGRYNISKRVFSSSLGFSFGSKIDDAWRVPQTPGPADYTSQTHMISHRAAQSAHGGKRPASLVKAASTRDKAVKEEVSNTITTFGRHKSLERTHDGNRQLLLLPDSMEVLRKTRSKLGTFSRAKSNDFSHGKDGKQLPGPGHYNPQVDYIRLGVQKGRGYTLAPKTAAQTSQEEEVPGPGMYQLPSTTNKTGWSLSKAKRLLGAILGESGRNPGPGTYNPSPILLSRSMSVTKDPREKPAAKAYIPGPGTYTLRKDPGSETPNYSFRGRTKFGAPFPAEVEQMGGLTQMGQEDYIPRDYSPNFKAVLPVERSITFARAARPDLGRGENSGPGIGAYSVPRDGVLYNTGCSFGTAKRSQEQKEEDVFPLPGPGSYTLKSTIPQLQIYEQQKLDILDEKAGLFGGNGSIRAQEFGRVKDKLQGAAIGTKIKKYVSISLIPKQQLFAVSKQINNKLALKDLCWSSDPTLEQKAVTVIETTQQLSINYCCARFT